MLAALALCVGCGGIEVLGRYYAPHARFPARPNFEVRVTEASPLELLQSGHANIGEMTLVGLQEDDLESLMDALLAEAAWAGGEQVRLEEVRDYEEQGWFEGIGECTSERETEVEWQTTHREYNEYGAYDVVTTYTWPTTECASHADVAGMLAKRSVQVTFWRHDPELAAAQLAALSERGGGPVAVTLAHSFHEERRACLAGRPQSCERAAQLADSLGQRWRAWEAAIHHYGLWCEAGVPASCQAAERLVASGPGGEP